MIVLSIIFNLVLGSVLLYYGADFLVRGGVKIALRIGVSSLVIGLTLVACSTSAPEFIVSLESAIDGAPDISVGNIVGSNICNILLILGVCALVRPLEVSAALLKFDAIVMFAATVVFSALILPTASIPRISAGILLAGFVFYTVLRIAMARKQEKILAAEKAEFDHAYRPEQPQTDNHPTSKTGTFYTIFLPIILVGLGLAALVAGAKFFLAGSIDLAKLCHLSEAVIGLTIVAVGTSLPELATSVVATLHGERDIAVGNVVGSNIFNILGIMGLAPLICPITNMSIGYISFGVMLFSTLIILPIMRTGYRISRWEGAFLLLVYVAYTAHLILRPDMA